MSQSISALWRELQRRKVVRVAIAYGAFAWLLLQFGDIAFDVFGTPGWSMRTLFVILLAGLPAVVVLAWVFEVTPGGIDRTGPPNRPKSVGSPVTLLARLPERTHTTPSGPDNPAGLLMREYALLAEDFHVDTAQVTSDGMVLEFAHALDAMAFASHAQAHARRLDLPLRMGMDHGTGGDAFRLAEMASPGSLWVSDGVYQELNALDIEGVRTALGQVVTRPGPGGTDAHGLDTGPLDAVDADMRGLGAVSSMGSQPSLLIRTLALAFLTAVVGLLWTLLPNFMDNDELPTLAVLPFENLAPDGEDATLAEGLSDDLFHAITQIDRIRIAARRASRTIDDTGMSVSEIGALLGAGLLLEGEIRPRGDRLLVNVWLTDTQKSVERWSQRYDLPRSQARQIREGLARDLAAELGLESGSTLLAGSVTESPEAYPLYLEARGYFSRPNTEANLGRAQALFEQAIYHAPDFVAAKAGLCQTYLAWYRTFKDKRQFETARAYCTEALGTQQDNVQVLVALGDLFLVQGDTRQARKYLELGQALNGEDVEIKRGLAEALIMEQRYEEAEEVLQYAIGLEPAYAPLYADLGRTYLMSNQPARAIEAYLKVTALEPGDMTAWSNLGASHYYLGDFEQAALAYEKSLALEETHMALSNAATMHYYAGDFVRARDLYARATELAPKDYRLWTNLADAERQVEGAGDDAEQRYALAYQQIIDSLEINPDDAQAHALAAWCAIQTGRPEDGQRYMQRAMQLDAENFDVIYYGALVAELSGDFETASQLLDQLVEKGFPLRVLKATPGLGELLPEA
ncbi:tetratricopeptide repeat protein [Marinihelvus fidelis]|uniref:Tetratricopeptide repeat protein n=1 Tax=Marinihelvus fidelis TaxID=2613842 RepID=A0A5N0T9B3_9GAMM|nr:tetratricopeptide repeat protein [Marinihelvus fidelis]KAA9131532.1 tetratricopeptide repeat protein [Marinihelvus fidelis]